MTNQDENALLTRLQSLFLNWRLVFGLVFGCVPMVIFSLYTVAAMAWTRRGLSTRPA